MRDARGVRSLAGEMGVFVARSRMPVPAAELFAWHARPGAFERLAPPWTRVEVIERRGGISDGAELVMRMHAGPLSVRWRALHRDYEEGRRFVDVQVEGPFREWVHTHGMVVEGAAASTLEDRVVYRVPGGPLAEWMAEPVVRRQLERMFRFRHARTSADLVRHASVADRPRLRVAVTGASGLVGSQLVAFLGGGGHRVERLVRAASAGAGEIAWQPERGEIDAAALEGMDAVVHLAGEGIATGRWTAARKRRIRESRVRGTELLARALAGLARPPRVLVSASAIGFYGDRGDEECTEASEAGAGFLADVCRDWEAATGAARAAGIRVVQPRLGMVLAAGGGALARMLPAFRIGAGGVLGSGRQWVSWIALDDVVGMLHALLFRDDVEGPVNLVAPQPVTNRELSATLGRVLGRPACLPLPAPAVRLAFGELGQALLLGGARVLPARLQAAGIEPLQPTLDGALRSELGYQP